MDALNLQEADPRYGPRDVALMRRALALAPNGLGMCAPNPMVGAVVVSGGQVVGEGWHEGPGTAHAEIVALRQAGDAARGATLYVTLEPCSHFGRTPPCAPVVAASGVARVVAAVRDPNPEVDGRGLEILREAGVDVVDDVLAAEAAELNPGFFKHWLEPMPFVTLKLAASLDGKVAAADGTSQWITGPAAREDVHRLRAASGAVVVGARTARLDDPSLTVRLDGYRGRQPLRVVIDAAGRLRAHGALFDGRARTMVATTDRAPTASTEAWAEAGAEVLVAPSTGSGTVALRPLFEHLSEVCSIQDVLIEGGPTLAWSAVAEGVVDRLVLYLAPKLLGGVAAPGILGGAGVASITDAVGAEIVHLERLGEDLKIVADVRAGRGGG